MPSLREAVRKQFKAPSAMELIVEALIRKAELHGEMPSVYGHELLELFLVNGVEQPGEAVVANGYSGRGLGVTLSLDWGILVCPGFVEGKVALGAGRSSGRQMMIALLRQPGIDTTPDKKVCFMVGSGGFVQWKVEVSASVGVKATAGLNAATGKSTMLQSKQARKQVKEQAASKHGTAGAVALGTIGLSAAAMAVAEAGVSYDAEWVFVRDVAPRWYDHSHHQDLKEDLQGWVDTGGTRAGVKERITGFFTNNEAKIGLLAPRLSNLQRLQRLFTGGKIPMRMYEAALLDLAAFLAWLEVTISGNFQATKRDLAALKKEIHAERSSRNWLSRRFYKAEKRAVKTKAQTYLNQVGQGFTAEEGLSGHASLAAIEARLDALNSALMMSTKEIHRLREASARYTAQVSAQLLKGTTPETEAPEVDPVSAASMPNNLTFISLVGTKKGAGAGIKLSAKAAINAPAIGSKLELTGETGIEHHRKFTDYRIQHYAARPAGGQNTIRVFTQDTHVAMIQTKIKMVGKAEGVVFGKEVIGPKVEKFQAGHMKEKAPGDYSTNWVNTMTYRSAHLTWTPPALTSNTTQSLDGTGYSLGASVPIDNFVELARGTQNVETLRYLSDAINVRPETLWDLFKTIGYLRDLNAQANGSPSAIIIESTFNVPSFGIPLKWVQQEPQIPPEALTTLYNSKPSLEALRVRYRAVDTYNEGANGVFKLGIPKTKLGLHFDLKSIREANISGIVELKTWWLGRFKDRNGDGQKVPENLVPPPVLIHQ